MSTFQDDDEDDDNRDSPQAMIDWLSDKSPDVWFEVTQHLNWDNSMGVLDWIISQPQCDKANAALVFWGCDPEHYLHNRADANPSVSDGFCLLDKVLRNWKSGFYARGELAWREDHQQARYRNAVAALPGRTDPLAIPGDLLAPISGWVPNVPTHLSVYHNAELRKLLWDLGTSVGFAPGSPEARRIDRRLQRAIILHFAGDVLGFWWRSLPWMAALAVVLIGGAFVLRYLVKGVVL